MTSRLESVSSSNLLVNKINQMFSILNQDFSNIETVTKEDVIVSFNEVVKKFYSTIGKPLFSYKTFYQGKMPNIAELNKSFILAQTDIAILYDELASLRSELSSNFNTLSGQFLKIRTSVSEVFSIIEDYKLQNSNRVSPAFCDTFLNLSKIEIDDKAYDKEKFFIDTRNQMALLPLDGEAVSLKPKRVQITDNSNGVSGNNNEIGAIARDNIQLLIDGNIDTWFEYEQVSKTKILKPTILELKIEFEEEKIFNLLEIAPVAFANGSYPAILSLSGSTDGSIFFDLNEFFLGEFSEDTLGNQVIQLGSDFKNPSDSNMLHFVPKKIKYLIIKFIEDAPYYIKTSSGIQNRIAIGIKEIKVKSQKYKNEGQLISSTHTSEKEINKITIETEEILPNNFNVENKYFISPDAGKNWMEIAPTGIVNSKADEVLNFNLDFLESNKKTETPVTSVKVKIESKISQSDNATAKGTNYKKIDKTEFTTISPAAKSFSIEKSPTDDVNLYGINYGSVGLGSLLKLSIKKYDDKYFSQLPLNVFLPGTIANKDDIEIISEGIVWTRTDTLSGKSSSGYYYEFDNINNQIIFARTAGSSTNGKVPNQDVFFRLKREKAFLKMIDSGAEVETKFSTDGVKENIKIYNINETVSKKDIKLRHNATIQRLGIGEINNILVKKDEASVLLTKVDFINGVRELTKVGDYSVDYVNGILYLYSDIPSNKDVIIEVLYFERKDIPFYLEGNSIRIKKENLTLNNKSFSITPTEKLYMIDLGVKSIEKGSILFVDVPSTLGDEISFSNMESSFNDSVSNQYCIDYRNGILYSRNGINEKISGTCSSFSLYIEYRLAYKIPQSAYSVVRDDKKIIFTDKWVSDSYIEDQNNSSQQQFYKIEYSYAEEIKESAGEMLAYSTPIILGYAVKTVSRDELI